MKLLRMLGLGKKRPGRVEWGGQYPDWASAQAAATGYDSGVILEKVAHATLAVERGEAVYERDSVLFDHVEYSWPLLASLLWIHAQLHRLHVLDFGGSLGSTWRQNRSFLSCLPDLEWKVVEQEGFVERGRRDFQTPPLSFHTSPQAACEQGMDLFLLASSLCYMEHYQDILDSALASGARFLAIDRTPFHAGDDHRIQLQVVPPEIYPASYPCHIFSRNRFLGTLEPDWIIRAEWICDLQPDPGATHRGLLLERRIA